MAVLQPLTKGGTNQTSTLSSTRVLPPLTSLKTSLTPQPKKVEKPTISQLMPVNKPGLLESAKSVFQGIQQAVAKIAKPKKDEGLGAPIGRLLQKVPDTTIKIPEKYKSKGLYDEIVEFVSGMPSAIVQNLGKDLEMLSTPEGKKQLKEGGKNLPKTISEIKAHMDNKEWGKAFETAFSNPAVAVSFDVGTFLPVGLIGKGIKGGIQAGLRKTAQQVVKEGIEEAEKKVVKTVVKVEKPTVKPVIEPKPTTPKGRAIGQGENYANQLGITIKDQKSAHGGHGGYNATDNSISIPSRLPKDLSRDEIISHEIGHQVMKKGLSQSQLDVFNQLIKENRTEVDASLRHIRTYESRMSHQGYLEHFADLYGKYVRGEQLPAGNVFKNYFDEVAPLQSHISPLAPKGGVPKELEPLAQKARKYKSAEEFIGGYYRNTNPKDVNKPLPQLLYEISAKRRKLQAEMPPNPTYAQAQKVDDLRLAYSEFWKIDQQGYKTLTDFYTQATKGGVGVKDTQAGLYDTKNLGKRFQSSDLEQGDIGINMLRRTESVRDLNPKTIATAKAKILKGESDPIVINKNNEILDGHNRFEAYKQLGTERVPILRVVGENKAGEARILNPRIPQPTIAKVQPKVEVKPKTVSVPREQLPVGTGKEKVSRLEARMKGVIGNATPEQIEQLGLSTFNQMNRKETIAQAANYVIKNQDEALDVLRGKVQAPKDIPPEAIYVALTRVAEGDLTLATKLSSLQATAIGQRLGLLAELDPNSPVKLMSDIVKIRAEAFKRRYGGRSAGEVSEKIVRDIKSKVKIPNKNDWNNFIRNLPTC